jgi:nucleotide-binding universal stress UspA family protein
MPEVETIICGVDASVGARGALRIAVDLGEMFGFRVVAVHVVDRIAADGKDGSGTATLRARGRAERVLAQILDDEELVGKIDRRAEVGDTAERLATAADEENAAVIVLESRAPKAGTGHRSRLANEITKRTAVPVALPAEGQLVAGRRKPELHGNHGTSSNGRLDPIIDEGSCVVARSRKGTS